MKSTTSLACTQAFNYSRIPNFIVDTSTLSFVEKKVLLFCYAIQVHEHIPIVNLIKGWCRDKTLPKKTLIPSQLRHVLSSLEHKGFIERIINNRKFTAVRLNLNHADIEKSKYFYLTKEVTSNQFLSLDNIANFCAYARFNATPTIYSTKLSSVLGVNVKTFRKNNLMLLKCQLLQSKTQSSAFYSNNNQITTHRIREDLYIPVHANKTVRSSFHTSRDDFYPLKIYFLTKIKNNETMQRILRMEKKKNSLLLNEYLEFAQQDECLNAVQMMLVQAGKPFEKKDLKLKILEIMVKKSKSDKLRIPDKRALYHFLVKTINANEHANTFDPHNFNFIEDLRKYIPFCLPDLVLNEEIKKAVAAGFKFKSHDHALSFFVQRISNTTYSSAIREEGVREKFNKFSRDNVRKNTSIKLGDILKGMRS